MFSQRNIVFGNINKELKKCTVVNLSNHLQQEEPNLFQVAAKQTLQSVRRISYHYRLELLLIRMGAALIGGLFQLLNTVP